MYMYIHIHTHTYIHFSSDPPLFWIPPSGGRAGADVILYCIILYDVMLSYIILHCYIIMFCIII